MIFLYVIYEAFEREELWKGFSAENPYYATTEWAIQNSPPAVHSHNEIPEAYKVNS